MTTCTQCGKPAVVQSEEASLCVDCFAKLQDALTKQRMADLQHSAMLMSFINYLDRYMWAQIGLTPPSQLVIPPGIGRAIAEQIVQNTLNIDNSTIGVLSLGQQNHLQNIAVNIGTVQNADARVAEALKELTAAVARSELPSEDKDEALEHLEELSTQAARSPEQRARRSTLKALLGSLQGTLQAGGSLAEVWNTWGTELGRFFGL